MKKAFKYILIIIIACLIPIGTKYGITYAKYAYNSVWNYYFKSKNFYFESNTLRQNEGKIVNNLWDGGHIYFDLKNNLNEFISSEQDISYKVTCTLKESSNNDAVCKVMDKQDTYEGVLSTFKTCTNTKDDGVDVKGYDKSTCEINGYTWENQPAIKELYFDVLDTDHAVVEINVTSTSPYKKTIKAEFTLNKDKQISGSIKTEYKDLGNTGNLILTNSFEENKCIRISWNSENLRYDLDKNKIESYATDSSGYINELDIKLNPKSSNIYKFYESNLDNYGQSSFTIYELDNCE